MRNRKDTSESYEAGSVRRLCVFHYLIRGFKGTIGEIWSVVIIHYIDMYILQLFISHRNHSLYNP